MAYWDGKRIVYWDDEDYPGHNGWKLIDCGCCNGIEWGGDYPKECRSCGGNGRMALHVKSGVLADYPGGPLRGKK